MVTKLVMLVGMCTRSHETCTATSSDTCRRCSRAYLNVLMLSVRLRSMSLVYSRATRLMIRSSSCSTVIDCLICNKTKPKLMIRSSSCSTVIDCLIYNKTKPKLTIRPLSYSTVIERLICNKTKPKLMIRFSSCSTVIDCRITTKRNRNHVASLHRVSIYSASTNINYVWNRKKKTKQGWQTSCAFFR